MVIETVEQAEDLKQKICQTAEDAYEQLKAISRTNSALEFLFQMKFSKIGFDPIEGTELNIIEQINQLFSDLVVVEALHDLLSKYPGKRFKLHLGSESGFDIESMDGEVAAECFAVTSSDSNRKLKMDSVKLMKKALHQKKYIYFYSQNDVEYKLENIYKQFPDITYVRIAKLI